MTQASGYCWWTLIPRAMPLPGLVWTKNAAPSVYDVIIGDSPCEKAIVTTPYGDLLPPTRPWPGRH